MSVQDRMQDFAFENIMTQIENHVPEPVKYYIGDLCYVIEDDMWSEVCILSFDPDNEDGDRLELEDGREFYILSTAYGDGVYGGNDGKAYCVDSGTIGAIRVENIRDQEKFANAIENGLGHVTEFNYDLDNDVCNEDGTLYFGSLAIFTNGSPDDDDELDVEEEDEYDDEDA